VGAGAGSYFTTTNYTTTASMTHTHGNMTWHYGGEFRILQQASGSYGNQMGTFSFDPNWTGLQANGNGTGIGSSMASFLLGLPNGGSLDTNANRFLSQHYTGLYFQNDWRVNSRLTLNMGLRWDYETPFVERFDRLTNNFDPTILNPLTPQAQANYTVILNNLLALPNTPANARKIADGQLLAKLVPAANFNIFGAQQFAGVNGQPRGAVNPAYNEWQPRGGFAYQIAKSTVVRGGIGRFVPGTAFQGGQNGFSRQSPFVASIDNNITPYDTLASPFSHANSGILLPTGSSLGGLTNLGQGVNWGNQDPGRPYGVQYSLQVQRDLKSWLIEVGYSHQQTKHIGGSINQNDIGLTNWTQLRAPTFDAAGKPINNSNNNSFFTDDQVVNPFKGLPGVSGSLGTSANINIYNLLRPLLLLNNQDKSDIPYEHTRYDALETKLQKRFTGGFSILAGYTWSKLFENTSFLGTQLAGNLEHKIGGEDRPNAFTLAAIAALPVGRDKKFFSGMPRLLDYALGGWELTTRFPTPILPT